MKKFIILRAFNAWKRALNYNSKSYWKEKGGDEYFRQYSSSAGNRNEDLILNILQNEKFNNLIDVGCGYGRYLKVISDKYPNAKLVGVDISPTQLEKAKEYLQDHKNIELREVDGIHLPYGYKFDVCLTYGCMIHTPH